VFMDIKDGFGMNDHQWMDVPDNSVSLLLRIHTLTHGDTVTLYYCSQACDCFLSRRCEFCYVRWLETQPMKIDTFRVQATKSSSFHKMESTRKRISMSGGAS
jgi:hypothetical protein